MGASFIENDDGTLIDLSYLGAVNQNLQAAV
jgi:hypothetical protein